MILAFHVRKSYDQTLSFIFSLLVFMPLISFSFHLRGMVLVFSFETYMQNTVKNNVYSKIHAVMHEF